MAVQERLELVAPCGIDCGICELYLCKDNPQLMKVLTDRGIPREKIPCQGCRPVRGNCPVIEKTCETFQCVSEKKAEFCFECSEFPCTRLHPSANRADVLPHNMKVFNLCVIKQMGLEAFIEKSPENKKRYYTARMEIGKGPQLP